MMAHSGLQEHVIAAMVQHIVAAYVGGAVDVDCPDLKPNTTFCAATGERDKSDAVRVMREAGVLRTRAELIRLQAASGTASSEWSSRDHKRGGRWPLGFTPRQLLAMARYAAQHGIPAADAALPPVLTPAQRRAEQARQQLRERRAAHRAATEAHQHVD